MCLSEKEQTVGKHANELNGPKKRSSLTPKGFDKKIYKLFCMRTLFAANFRLIFKPEGENNAAKTKRNGKRRVPQKNLRFTEKNFLILWVLFYLSPQIASLKAFFLI